MFEDLLDSWNGEQVLVHHDIPTRTWMFVCIHSSRLGPSAGGTRMRVYDSPADALEDGLRLSSAMTSKLALTGLPFGGGKSVLAVPEVPEGDLRHRIIGRFADMVGSLQGSFYAGPDMNTGEADMDIVHDRCGYSLGRSPSRGGSGNSGPDTAMGVFHGIAASLGYALGSNELAGRSVVIQGAGVVGTRLAELLVGAGAKVVVADVDEGRAGDLVERLGIEALSAEDAVGAECDVLAPCAVGGVISQKTVPKLRCRIVAGAANNQLEQSKDAELLRDAGILYAPDYVINGGGALHLSGLEVLGWSRERLDRALREIGDSLVDIYRTADREGVSTEAAAERLVEERLAAAG